MSWRSIVKYRWLPLIRKLKSRTIQFNQSQLFQQTRTRILLWYFSPMLLFITIAIPTIRYRLITTVTERVKADMREEIEAFDQILIESLLESQQDPTIKNTQYIQKNQDIYRAFDKYISSIEAEDDDYFITIVNGEFYKASSSFLPSVIDQNSALMQRWLRITEEERVEVYYSDPQVESVIYKAEPIETTQEVIGVFVVAHISAGERQEALSALCVIIQIILLSITAAFFLAWLGSGKVLAPLQDLSDTVKSISESDLSQRINIEGEGEVAKLSLTFNAMMDRLETAFDTQRNFINDAGHELRTPITIIRGHLELMDDDPKSQQETVELVIDELDRMNRLVEDLILLAKAERQDFLRVETIELNDFVTEIFYKLQTLGERNWHLEHYIPSGKMIGDHQRITQAIINLAHNAVQHTNPDSLIVFGAKLAENKVKFWICDTGEGIPADEQRRVFERFTRVKNSPRRSDGSGLGLAIVKAVTEAHYGAIDLQSTLGSGSTFTMILPVNFNE